MIASDVFVFVIIDHGWAGLREKVSFLIVTIGDPALRPLLQRIDASQSNNQYPQHFVRNKTIVRKETIEASTLYHEYKKSILSLGSPSPSFVLGSLSLVAISKRCTRFLFGYRRSGDVSAMSLVWSFVRYICSISIDRSSCTEHFRKTILCLIADATEVDRFFLFAGFIGRIVSAFVATFLDSLTGCFLECNESFGFFLLSVSRSSNTSFDLIGRKPSKVIVLFGVPINYISQLLSYMYILTLVALFVLETRSGHLDFC